MSKRSDARTEAEKPNGSVVDYLVSVNPLSVRSEIEEIMRLSRLMPGIPLAEPAQASHPRALSPVVLQVLRDLSGPEEWADELGPEMLGVSVARPDPVWDGMSHTMH